MTGLSSRPSDDDDTDFFGWTRNQADALRALAREGVCNRVDIEHVAEEIEDLGKRDLREVESCLARLFEHLLTLALAPGTDERSHWRSESLVFQTNAADAFSPSMRRLIDLDRIWRRGEKLARAGLADIDRESALGTSCPFVLDELLSEDFSLDAALARIAARPEPDRP